MLLLQKNHVEHKASHLIVNWAWAKELGRFVHDFFWCLDDIALTLLYYMFIYIRAVLCFLAKQQVMVEL